MTSGAELVIHTDGAARGNPGPAAYAYTIRNGDGEIIDEAGCLGTMTNNQAEYIALVKALEHAERLGTHHRLRIHSDSELLVKQMNGEYRVKDAKLQQYYREASKLVDEFDDVKIRHVPRAENSRADRLCNEALDGIHKSRSQPESTVRPKESVVQTAAASSTPAPVSRDAKVRAKVLECLSHAAREWSRGDPADPPVESVLDDIWNILANGGK